MGSTKLTIKRAIVKLICMPIIADWIFRWHRGRIPFRGMKIETSHNDVPRSVVPRIFWNLYERAEVDFVASHLRPDLTVVELGSCLGVVACSIASKQNLTERLISVEANPNLREVILENVGRNVSGKKIEVVTGAIDYSGAETVRFAVSHDAVSSHVSHAKDGDGYEVRALQLHQLLDEQNINGPFALVCDIEAAEAGIILSDKAALKNCQQVIIEMHPGSYDPWQTELDSLLQEMTNTHQMNLAASRGHVYFFERTTT